MIELPVNLAIMGILTAISVSTSMSHKKQAHVTSAKADFKNVHLAVEALAADTEKRPGPNGQGQNDYDPDDVYRILPFPVQAAVLRIGPKHL